MKSGHTASRGEELTETFLDTFHVVIFPATRLTSFQKTLQHNLLRSCKEENKGRLAHLYRGVPPSAFITRPRLGTYVFVEFQRLVHLAGESVNQETALVVLPTFAFVFRLEHGAHGVLEQLDGNLHRHDLAFANVRADHISKLGAFAVLLCSQQITGY